MHGKFDRLAISVISLGTDQTSNRSSTGVTQAADVRKTLAEWNVTVRIKTVCFETTSSKVNKKKRSYVIWRM